MSIKVALEHRTSYTFDRRVRVYPHIVRLRPAPHSRTPIGATGFTPGKLDLSDIREKRARIVTDIGAPGILDLRRVRTVAQ